jgi:hypothetical protein
MAKEQNKKTLSESGLLLFQWWQLFYRRLGGQIPSLYFFPKPSSIDQLALDFNSSVNSANVQISTLLSDR